MSETKRLAKDLYTMTWPMLLGVLSLMSFLLADSIFISRLGVEPLAVMGFSIPIYQCIIGLQVGFGIATTALISQLLGANKTREAEELGGTIVLIGSGIVFLMCLLIWLFRHPVLLALGAEPRLLPLADAFWAVFLLSAFLGALLYLGYSLCRAHGNTKLPGLVMMLTSLLNIALDPLFMFYFDLGLVGAAYATLMSYSIGLALVFPTVQRNTWLRIERHLDNFMTHSKALFAIACPAIASQLFPALSSMLATNAVSEYGTVTIAAWGSGLRLEYFLLVMILALTMSRPPMIGRFYGEGDVSQIGALVKVAALFVIGWQVCIGLIALVMNDPISTLLGDDLAVSEQLSLIVMAFPLSYAPLGICMIVVSICNAMGAPKQALFISFARLFICFLPSLWLGSYVGGFAGLVIGAALGNLFAGMLAWRLYQKTLSSLTTHQPAH